jgi:hypothetical protein
MIPCTTAAISRTVKEGKGETHYLQKGMPDSVIKGYWVGMYQRKEIRYIQF